MQDRWNSPIASNPVVRSEINGRDRNEDSFVVHRLIIPDGAQSLLLLALADGMGGYAHGADISEVSLRKACLSVFEDLCVERAINHLNQDAPVDTTRLGKFLFSALERTCAHVRRMVQNNNWGKAGSTIVMAGVLDDTCVAVNLGDSPMFHFKSSNGQVRQITDDHTVTGALLRADRISPALARVHEGRNVLEFYLGAERMPREHPLHQVKLADGDLLLLCSDGVTGELSLDAVRQCLADAAGNLVEAADSLIRAAVAAGETDNLTLILWRYDKPATPAKPAAPTLILSRQDAAGASTATYTDDSAMRSDANPSEATVPPEAISISGSDTLVLHREEVGATGAGENSALGSAPASSCDTTSGQTAISAAGSESAEHTTTMVRGIELTEVTPRHDTAEEHCQ